MNIVYPYVAKDISCIAIESHYTTDIHLLYRPIIQKEGLLLDTLLYLILIVFIIWLVHLIRKIYSKSLRLSKQTHAIRLAECEKIVKYFANNHGYIARSVVSREELREQIETGISANTLKSFIEERILKAEGLSLGYQLVDQTQLPVVLPDKYRDKHIYIVGKSGYGKTNFLRHLIFQDLAAGVGLGVLAPEYEMLNDEILPFIPEERIQDVIYFNPADTKHPVVLNPLHIDEGEDIDLQVDETFAILQRVVGEGGGPRMDEILRHSLYALIEKPNTTLLDFEPLLDRQDSSFRNAIVQTTADEQTRRFFQHTYPQFPKDSHIPIINRIGRIIRARYTRNCLCPPKNTTLSKQEAASRLLNIRQAMDQGKILLFNLSDGILGEVASQLIGELIVSKFQTATMSRANVSKQYRKPFYLYLDEFQNFCGAARSYEKILSRARKYKLGMILAHQQTGQLSSELLREIFGNVSTLVSFQVSQPDAVRLSKEFLSQQDFDIKSVPPEEFLQLNIGQAYCKIAKSAFPFYIPKVDDKPDRERARQVIENSQKMYGIPRITKSEQARLNNQNDSDDPLADLDPEGVFD